MIASEQTFFPQYAVPPQTTITQDYKAAVADVVEAWLDGLTPERKTVIPYNLIVRESIMPLPASKR